MPSYSGHVEGIKPTGEARLHGAALGDSPSLVIDTTAVLEDFHHLADLFESELDDAIKQHLIDLGKAAWLALEPYLPKEQPPVQEEHYEIIRRFRELVARCRTGLGMGV